MSLKLRLFVYGVIAAAAVLLVLDAPRDVPRLWIHYVVWIGITIVSEKLWLKMLSGESTVAMSSTINLAALMLWGRGPGMWIGALGVLVADITIRRKPWIRAGFNTGQTAVTLWMAGIVMMLLGAPAEGLVRADRLTFTPATGLALLPAFLGLTVVYHVLNRGFVSTAVAWSSGRGVLQVLRQDWFYRERLLDDFALYFLAPLMVIAYGAIRYLGVVLFWVPLQIIYESSKRYLELVNSQRAMIQVQRAAAVGDMAAEVGHELRSPLTVVRERTKLILRDIERDAGVINIARHAHEIIEQSERMTSLADNLMNYREARIEPTDTDLNELVQRKIEQIKPMELIAKVAFETSLDPRLPKVQLDAPQMGDVLVILFNNASQIMEEHAVERRVITVETEYDKDADRVVLSVRDSGPGIPPAVLPKIFLKHFTARKGGHGFGLNKAARVVNLHGGEIVAESDPGEGATFVIKLPLRVAAKAS